VTSRRNVIAYFFAFLTSEGATQVLAVAVGWTVYGIHHRPFDLGLVGLVMFVPSLLLVFVAGHAVDRYDRKRIVVIAALGVALCAFVLAALAFANVRSLVLMLTVLFALGIARAFGSPAERTILVNIVETADYMRVQARYASAREIVVISAPAIGGALVAFSDLAAFITAGLMTLAAAAGFSILHVRSIKRAKGGAINPGSALDGVRFIRSRPVVLGAISLDLFAVLFGGATALLPIYADQILHVGALGFGMLRSASGLGASVMAIVLSHRTPNRRVGRTMLTAVAGYGLCIVAFAYSRYLWLSILALASAGALDMISVVIRRGLVQLNTPDEKRGRVAAIESVFVGASSNLGAFESGTAAQLFGPVLGVALGGVATLGVVLIWALAFPALRASNRLDDMAANSFAEEPERKPDD
jgi:MFS family permease